MGLHVEIEMNEKVIKLLKKAGIKLKPVPFEDLSWRSKINFNGKDRALAVEFEFVMENGEPATSDDIARALGIMS